MGHYDDCYAHDREQNIKKRLEWAHEELTEHVNKFLKEGDLSYLEMLVDICNNIENWSGVYNLLNKE